MNEVFELVEVNEKMAVLKVAANDNLTLAMHPYLNGIYDYITVTRGEDHLLNIVKKDGSSFAFEWGFHGHTLISDKLQMLKEKVVEFLERNGIFVDFTNDDIVDKKIFYNKFYNRWAFQITNEKNQKHVYMARNAKSRENRKAFEEELKNYFYNTPNLLMF